MLKLLHRYFKLGALWEVPGGAPIADSSSMFGVLAAMDNINNYAEGFVSITATQTANIAISVANLFQKNIVLVTGTLTGAFTITLPSTASILAILQPTVPLDGSFWFPLYINNRTNQTGTLTAGDSNTVVNATENTLATNIAGKWMVNLVAPVSSGGLVPPTLALFRSFTGST